MLRRLVVWSLVGAIAVGVLGLGRAVAQERDGDRRDDRRDARRDDRRRPRDPEEMRRRFEEFRQRMEERMRERLGATEAEWKVLGPRLDKVQQLMRQTRGGFRGRGGPFGRGRRGDRDRRPGEEAEREQPEIEKKTEALRSLLEDENASPQSIKAALDALRRARQQAQQELAAARKQLREVVTAKQEAQLVLMGILD